MMGTSYTLHKQGNIELAVDEMSNKFSIGVFGEEQGEIASVDGLSVDELVRVGIECLRVASYWTDDEGLRVAAYMRHIEDKRNNTDFHTRSVIKEIWEVYR